MKSIISIITIVLVHVCQISFAQEQKKPNVLFIISDDLTATTLSCYENTMCKTPNIDALAAEGMRYTKTYCQYPVCGPSRSSIMFGYYPNAVKKFKYAWDRETVGSKRKSWSQLFKDNGYYSARVGKIYHMGVPGGIEAGTNGADDEDSWTERYNSQGPEWKAIGEGELVQNNPYSTKPIEGGNVMTIVKADGGDLVHADGKSALKASELIKKHKNESFFLAVGLVRPHVPFVAPKAYFDAYPYEQIVLPPKVEGDWDDIPESGINYVTSLNAKMSEEQEKKAIAGYYASVSFMDAQVGKILKTLKEEGLEDNTIVIFTSDHGYHLAEHRFWMKVSLHDESIRVPLIIKVPGKKPGVCHSFAELIDLYPTVAELAGLKYSKHLQGKSLAKTLDNSAYKVRDAVFSVSLDLKANGSLDSKGFQLQTRKWAYIQYGEDAKLGIELFDMEYDSKQYNNLANNPKYEKIVQAFQERLRVKLKEVRDNDLELN